MSDPTASNATRATGAAACSSPGDCAIRIEGLQHHFGEGDLRRQVLFNNTLEIARGEIVIMTGPSGSGKTTLLTLIGTLRRVQAGSVEVLGRQLCGASPEELIAARQQIGFIFQQHNLFAALTAQQNVRMALELFGVPRPEADRRAIEALCQVGLQERVLFKPAKLSGGQKQRVAVARGLVHRPQLILADEPTAALDEKSGRQVVTLFQELAKRQKCTILMVTHDNRILDIADRIVNMVDGWIKSSVLVQNAAEICEFLKQCPLFAQFTPRTLTYVADQMKLERHAPGAEIVRQGDVGDKFYLMRSGTVDVMVTEDKVRRKVATLGRGAYFGEVALLEHKPRNASVVAAENVEVYSLGAREFQAVVMASATFEEELRKALFERQ
jgi:putative ABC transport system ATP-binding protein